MESTVTRVTFGSSDIPPTGMSADLTKAIEELNSRRGSTQQWYAMEEKLIIFIAGCTHGQRVWCKGEVHAPTRHYPAVLYFDAETQKVVVKAPSGDEGAMEEHPIHLFWSTVPHIAHCRTVLDKEQRNSTL